MSTPTEKELKQLAARLNHLFENIYNLTDPDGNGISEDFQRLPSRLATDYYKFIRKPISLYAIGRKVKKQLYENAQAFVNDMAQITWNARHYNEPGSPIHERALILENYVRDTIVPRLSADSRVPGALSLHYPDLGPLDSFDREDESAPDGSSKDDDDDDDDDGDDDDNDSFNDNYTESFKDRGYYEEDDAPNYKSEQIVPSKYPEGAVRRGRPPIIDKPFESRIKSILKHFKNVGSTEEGENHMSAYFERLPDKSNSAYYSMIQRPISLYEIRTRVRTRKYSAVDQFLDDLKRMINNAKVFYANDPAKTNELVAFENEAMEIISIEMQRPEKDFIVAMATPDKVKLPLDEVTVHGHSYKVGDWVLIRNPNDATKPSCAQIFRLWSSAGINYINVCWYIRPEQTCHRADRLFYINEVCKTGEYTDHRADDIVGLCYVIFLTHYQKGDIPPNLLADGCQWFICEFRYNVATYAFNRIRTWKACLPDEVRHIDQPIVPLQEARKIVKFDSPLKHMLSANTPDDPSKVSPVAGPVDGPPISGAIFQKPPFYNDELGQCSTSPNVTRTPENDDIRSRRMAYVFTPVSQLKALPNSGIYATSGTRPVSVTYTPGAEDEIYKMSAYSSSYGSIGLKHHGMPGSTRELTPAGRSQLSYPIVRSTYSEVLPGGIVSYVENETGGLEEVSDLLVMVSDRIVWFRTPPTKIPSGFITPVSHSAKYLAWKLQKTHKR